VAGLVGWALVKAVKAEPAVVGAVGTASLGAAGVVWQQRQAEKARLREAHRDRMAPTYDKFLQLVRQRAGEETSETQAEIEVFMRDLKARQLLLGAPREIIQAFNRWESETMAAQASDDLLATAFAWENLLRAIRRDLVHDDAKLPPGELLRVYTNDFDEFLAASNERSDD
jgi:hypothetical protein